MPFDLTDAPAVFQCLVNGFLRDILGRFVFVYLNDILICPTEPSELVQHVWQVLWWLLENRLFIKSESANFMPTRLLPGPHHRRGT